MTAIAGSLAGTNLLLLLPLFVQATNLTSSSSFYFVSHRVSIATTTVRTQSFALLSAEIAIFIPDFSPSLF